MNLVIETKEIGRNQLKELRNQLNDFVKSNFELLYEGAIRLKLMIRADYYAPRRIQIGETRLHESIGLKYADGHKYCWEEGPSEEQIRNTVKDLQILIDAASKDIIVDFTIEIKSNY